MKSLTVVAKDRLGLLADISYILSKCHINIEGLCADAVGGNAILSIEVKDISKAAQVLENNGFKVIPQDSLVVKVSNGDDLKGILEEQKISVAGVSEITSDTTDRIVALNVDKPRRASRLLSQFLFPSNI